MISKNQQKYIKSLELKKNRKKDNVFVAEGFKIVEELIQAGYHAVMEHKEKILQLVEKGNVADGK